MPNARIARLQRYAFDHPLVTGSDSLTSHSYLHMPGGVTIALSLNK